MKGTRGHFMVERYVAGITDEEVASGVARLEETTKRMAREGIDVRHLGSTFVPSEGSVFCVFEGPSQESVEDANRRAHFLFHRIVAATFRAGQLPRGGGMNRLQRPAEDPRIKDAGGNGGTLRWKQG
jgi:hypothetical protein